MEELEASEVGLDVGAVEAEDGKNELRCFLQGIIGLRQLVRIERLRLHHVQLSIDALLVLNSASYFSVNAGYC